MMIFLSKKNYQDTKTSVVEGTMNRFITSKKTETINNNLKSQNNESVHIRQNETLKATWHAQGFYRYNGDRQRILHQ